MGWQLVSLLRRGIWAAMTGGCYLEPKQSGFSNTFHLYLWIALLGAPFVLHLNTNLNARTQNQLNALPGKKELMQRIEKALGLLRVQNSLIMMEQTATRLLSPE